MLDRCDAAVSGASPAGRSLHHPSFFRGFLGCSIFTLNCSVPVDGSRQALPVDRLASPPLLRPKVHETRPLGLPTTPSNSISLSTPSSQCFTRSLLLRPTLYPLTDILGKPKYLGLTDSVRQPQTYLLNGTESKKRYGSLRHAVSKARDPVL